jgi:hypothetical protein
LVAGYEAITGDMVRTTGKQNLVATCYRVHGAALLPLVERHFKELGTATNLLGIIRSTPPIEDDRDEPVDVPGAHGGASSEEGSPDRLLPGLTYGEHNRPAFDPTSKRRYDLHPSNPDAAALFTDQELGVRPEPSPTARAIGR